MNNRIDSFREMAHEYYRIWGRPLIRITVDTNVWQSLVETITDPHRSYVVACEDTTSISYTRSIQSVTIQTAVGPLHIDREGV